MTIGYCVPVTPQMASYRLRVAIPAPLLGRPYEIGTYGDVSFFYKHFEGDLELARNAGPFIYDVVNDHFGGKHATHYQTMCGWAAKITCASEAMAGIIRDKTGQDAEVIDDPYENEESEASCSGRRVLWFGHQANIRSLAPYLDLPELVICSNFNHPLVRQWSLPEEARQLHRAAVVLLTGDSPGASANRVAKALRAGRFVVTPGGVPAWDEFKDYIWVGDVEKGVAWALANREEACEKIRCGQQYTRERFTPSLIAAKWTAAFDSISPQVTSGSRAGYP
jgi:hypothetical protein